MKKITLILLLTAYIMSVSGITVNRFYCCGKLESTTISAFAFGKNSDGDNGCCKHRQNVLKVSDSHEVSLVANTLKTPFDYLHATLPAFPPATLNNTVIQGNHCQINAPPLPGRSSLYTQFCNFRI